MEVDVDLWDCDRFKTFNALLKFLPFLFVSLTEIFAVCSYTSDFE